MANENILNQEVEQVAEPVAEEVAVEEVTCDDAVAVGAPGPKKKKVGKAVKKAGMIERKWSWDRILVFILFVSYSVSLLGGVFWAILVSLMDRYEYMSNPLKFPDNWLFSNYIEAFNSIQAEGKNMFAMLGDSFFLSIIPPTVNLLTASMASYVMAKYKFPGRDLIWAIMIIMMVLPLYGGGAATYKLYDALGMLNSPRFFLASITSLGGSMMLIAAFKGVSKTYGEAAFIEGCGHFRVFLTIILPQITALLTALWITSFIGHWNDYMTALMYMDDYMPVSTGLYMYQIEQGRRLNTPILFAGSILLLLIPTLLFAIFQNKFSEMSFGGGIKG